MESRSRTAFFPLALFAQARQRAISKAYRERKPWPPEWLADVHAAYAVLAKHPLGTDANAADCYDFLRWLGATPRALASSASITGLNVFGSDLQRAEWSGVSPVSGKARLASDPRSRRNRQSCQCPWKTAATSGRAA